MSGGLRTSVKGYLIARRLSLTGDLDTVHEMNETINRNFSAPQATADYVDKKKQQDHSLPLPAPQNTIPSSSSEQSVCDDISPCLPMLSSAPKDAKKKQQDHSLPLPQIAATDYVDKKKEQDHSLPLPAPQKSIAASPSGPSICDNITPCLPMLSSAPKSMDSYDTRIRDRSPPEDVPSTPWTEGEIVVKRFFFNELKTATWNFHPHNKLGEGGFGSVFKGWIDDNSFTAANPGSGTLIAVKRVNPQGFQGHKEWLAEIYYLGRLRHPNLVKLLGYCYEDVHQLLVYELSPHGSLDNHLFGRASNLQPLSWILRMKIALGAAKAVAFLHSSQVKVIHGDFKSSNILLDSAYNAKLSDFGLARHGRSDVSTRVMGTYGYTAPEYIATGHLNFKSDVYGFGVVMLELLCGRRVVDDSRPTGEQNLVEWARPYLASKRRVVRIFDARIEGQYSLAAALEAANLANQCLSTDPNCRPNMNEVIKALELLQESSDIPGSRISQHEPYQTPRGANSSIRWRSLVNLRLFSSRSYIR